MLINWSEMFSTETDWGDEKRGGGAPKSCHGTWQHFVKLDDVSVDVQIKSPGKHEWMLQFPGGCFKFWFRFYFVV